MDLLESFLLGLLQGITEFLPISSSGHLVLAQHLLGLDSEKGITFEIVVHFGSLLSIILYFRRDILSILQQSFILLSTPSTLRKYSLWSAEQRVILYILISMIPAFLVGIFLKSYIEDAFESPFWVSSMLIITGFVLFSTKYAGRRTSELNPTNAAMIGVAQAIAILPGISRSGSTIAMAQHLGLSRDDSARFSFLMVIPVIAGAMLLEIIDLLQVDVIIDYSVLFTGFFSSAVSGYIALVFLIKVIRRFGIHWFAIYCWCVGLMGLWYFWA
jgi:undecaprenyl-diphosphatase